MELQMKLTLNDNDDEAAKARRKDASEKKAEAKKEPTWEEVWDGDGDKVTGIWERSNSAADKAKLEAVKLAVESGEIGTFVDSLKKFNKTHALRLYGSLMVHRRESILAEMVKETPANYRLIQTEEQLEILVADLGREPIIAVDTETTGLDVFVDEIVGISFSLPNADYHVYIPVAHKCGQQLPRAYVLDKLRPILESEAIEKVLHNAKFDVHMFLRHGVRMRGRIHDTRIIMALLNENEPTYALKHLATKYGRFLGFKTESHTFEELFGKTRFDEVNLAVALVYAAKDTHLTWRLFCWQMEHLRKLREVLAVYERIEQPIIPVCVGMEQAGFLIDLDYAKPYGEKLRAELQGVEAELVEAFGEINFNSPAQLAAKLYDELGLPEINDRSTDVKTLKTLKGKHPGIEKLLRFREITKLLGTYVEALPAQIKVDGRIHGSFNQVATVTGRFSSNGPNLQNLPPDARKLIVAPPGKVLIGIDFSQIEPRTLSHMSGDPHMREPYLTGKDLYSSLASRVFGLPLEECGDGTKPRKKMKVGLLAVMYGTSDFTLAEQLGITVEEARQMIRDFFESHPLVHRFIKETWEFVKEHEYVTTLYGRKRRFPGHREKARIYDDLAKKICEKLGTDEVPHDFWQTKLPYDLKRRFQDVKGEVERVRRMAVNARIQGTAADIMKLAMIRLFAYCEAKGWSMCGTVHDEALILVDDTITPSEIQDLEQCMIGAVKLDVPLKVDTELMTRWGEGVKKEEWFANGIH